MQLGKNHRPVGSQHTHGAADYPRLRPFHVHLDKPHRTPQIEIVQRDDRHRCLQVPCQRRRPLAELPFPSMNQLGGGRKQWRQTATYTRVRAEGCYAYQIDGTTFSRVVVFRAAP